MTTMDILLLLGMALAGAAVIVLVYWLAKRADAKENGETPPTLVQTMKGLFSTQGGGGPRPKDPN